MTTDMLVMRRKEIRRNLRICQWQQVEQQNRMLVTLSLITRYGTIEAQTVTQLNISDKPASRS